MTVLERKNLRRAMYSREALKTEEEEEGRRKVYAGIFLLNISPSLCCQCVLFAFKIWLKWHFSKTACYTESLGLNDLRRQFAVMLSHPYLNTSSLPNSLFKAGQLLHALLNWHLPFLLLLNVVFLSSVRIMILVTHL